MQQLHPDGYLADPGSGAGSGVMVLHAWWGLNNTIKAFCERLADAGFIAFAPDLYHGKVADTIPDAEVLGSTVDANYFQVKHEIAQAAMFLSQRVGHNGHELAVVASASWVPFLHWISPQLIPNIFVLSSSFTAPKGPWALTSAARVQATWVTLPKMIPMRPSLMSTTWSSL
jgi:hypothetical protein